MSHDIVASYYLHENVLQENNTVVLLWFISSRAAHGMSVTKQSIACASSLPAPPRIS